MVLERFIDYSNPNSLGSLLRRRRRYHIANLIDSIYARVGHVNILDLGGRRQYWKMFEDSWLSERHVHITIVNVETDAAKMAPDQIFTTITGDACGLTQFADNQFDLTHSNSTIEHVGDWERMEKFAHESRRLAPCYYLQTPYFWFPIEPHFLAPFFHWLPEGWRAKLLLSKYFPYFRRRADMGEAMRDVLSARLLDKAQLSFLFPDADIRFEWFGPFPKSLIAIRNRS